MCGRHSLPQPLRVRHGPLLAIAHEAFEPAVQPRLVMCDEAPVTAQTSAREGNAGIGNELHLLALRLVLWNLLTA